jgi:hypothetical protein
MAEPSSARTDLTRNRRAVAEAREADRVEPRADSAWYSPAEGLVLVRLRRGGVFGFDPARVPGLVGAAVEHLGGVRISPSGDGLHWDALDADASLTGLISDALGLDEWAPRIMGQRRSRAKAEAARINGRKGGRPRLSR